MKRAQQLGMNPSTASGRLVKDLLWNYIVNSGHNKCHQCGEEMTRDTFSIEHKIPWLDSKDPVGLYFNLENISYSHQSCNYTAARRPTKGECSVPCGTIGRYKSGCRCDDCRKANSERVNNSRQLRPNRR